MLRVNQASRWTGPAAVANTGHSKGKASPRNDLPSNGTEQQTQTGRVIRTEVPELSPGAF